MIDTSKGMVWYRVFQVILVLWIISGVIASFIHVGSFLTGYYQFPLYSAFMAFQAIALTALSVRLFNAMRDYEARALKRLKMLCWFAICDEFVGLSILALEYAVITADVVVYTVSSSAGSAVVLIPTYFYLRKRCHPYWYQNKSFDKLVETTPPEERNQFFVSSEITNAPIGSSELNATSQSSISESCNDPLPAADPVAIEQPLTHPVVSAICFCRYCGTELRAESKFCDNCGKKVRK